MRGLFSSEWTAVGIGAVMLLLHGWWFWTSNHQAEVLSGFGAALTVLGVFVAAQPYIGKGLYETAREQVGICNPGDSPRLEPLQDEETESEGVRHVLKERVYGVILISVGSVLNGYGPALARALSLRGS